MYLPFNVLRFHRRRAPAADLRLVLGMAIDDLQLLTIHDEDTLRAEALRIADAAQPTRIRLAAAAHRRRQWIAEKKEMRGL